jgi:hypothetical protein
MSKLFAALISFAFAGAVLAQTQPAEPLAQPTDAPKAEAPAVDKAGTKTTPKKTAKKKSTKTTKSKPAAKTEQKTS